jgi:hypothetical protein
MHISRWLSLFLSASSAVANEFPSAEALSSLSQQRSYLRNYDLEEKTIQVSRTLILSPLSDLGPPCAAVSIFF